jgi:GNAT superfamily N-acetyltransferase
MCFKRFTTAAWFKTHWDTSTCGRPRTAAGIPGASHVDAPGPTLSVSKPGLLAFLARSAWTARSGVKNATFVEHLRFQIDTMTAELDYTITRSGRSSAGVNPTSYGLGKMTLQTAGSGVEISIIFATLDVILTPVIEGNVLKDELSYKYRTKQSGGPAARTRDWKRGGDFTPDVLPLLDVELAVHASEQHLQASSDDSSPGGDRVARRYSRKLSDQAGSSSAMDAMPHLQPPTDDDSDGGGGGGPAAAAGPDGDGPAEPDDEHHACMPEELAPSHDELADDPAVPPSHEELADVASTAYKNGRRASIFSTRATAKILGLQYQALASFRDAAVGYTSPVLESSGVARAMRALVERPRMESCVAALGRSDKGATFSIEDLTSAVEELARQGRAPGPKIELESTATYEFIGRDLGVVLLLMNRLGACAKHPDGSVKHSELYKRSQRGCSDVIRMYADDKSFSAASGRGVSALRVAVGSASMSPEQMNRTESLYDCGVVTVDETYRRQLKILSSKKHNVYGQWLTKQKERAMIVSMYVTLQCLKHCSARMDSIVSRLNHDLRLAASDLATWAILGDRPERPWSLQHAAELAKDSDDSDDDPSAGLQQTIGGMTEYASEAFSCPSPELSKSVLRPRACDMPSDGCASHQEVAATHEMHPRLHLDHEPFPVFCVDSITWSPTPIIMNDRDLRDRMSRCRGCAICGGPHKSRLGSRGNRRPWSLLDTPLGRACMLFGESFSLDDLHDSTKVFKRMIFHSLKALGARRMKDLALRFLRSMPSCMGLGLDSIIFNAYKSRGKIVFPSRLADVMHLGSHLPLFTAVLLHELAACFQISFLCFWQIGHCTGASASRFEACAKLMRQAFVALGATLLAFPELWWGFGVEPEDEAKRDGTAAENGIGPLIPMDLEGLLEDVAPDATGSDGEVDSSDGEVAGTADNALASSSSDESSSADEESSDVEEEEVEVVVPLSGRKRPRGRVVQAPAASVHGRKVAPVAPAELEFDIVEGSKHAAHCRKLAVQGAYLYPSLHALMYEYDSFARQGVPCALSTATGEHGFMPIVMLMSVAGGNKRARVSSAFRKASLRALLRVLPCYVRGKDGNPVSVLIPPPVVRCKLDVVGAVDARRIRAYRGKGLQARDHPMQALLSITQPDFISPLAAAADHHQEKKTILRSLHWRSGLGGRLRLGWLIANPATSTACMGDMPPGHAVMIVGMYKAARSNAIVVEAIPYKEIVLAIETLVICDKLEAAALFQVHCLLACGARVFAPERDSDAPERGSPVIVFGDEDFKKLRACSPGPIVGPASPMLLRFASPVVAPGAPLTTMQVDVETGAFFNSAGLPIAPTARTLRPDATRKLAVVPMVDTRARRCLLVQLPACRSEYRDLAATPLPPRAYYKLRELDIRTWACTVPLREDRNSFETILLDTPFDENRVWELALVPSQSWQPVGWLAWRAGDDQNDVESMHVMHASRRQGIGSKLLELALEHRGQGLYVPRNSSLRKLVAQAGKFVCTAPKEWPNFWFIEAAVRSE